MKGNAPRVDPQQVLPSQENLLLDYVQRLEQHRKGRKAVHLHLSQLAPQNRRPTRINIAANTFESLVRTLQGQLFVLNNSDFMFIYKSLHEDEVVSAIVKLQFMFADDDMLINTPDGDFGQFASFYDVAQDYAQMLKVAQQLVAEEVERRQTETVAKTTAVATRTRTRKLDPLTPSVLHRLEEALVQADLSNLVRRQSVCAIIGKSPPQSVFTEIFVSIPDLRATLLPNIDITSNRWLFQHLTDTLDRRVLSMLHKNDDRTLDSDFSINLNVPTLVSPDFLKFDDNVKAGVRNTIIIELQEMDVFNDVAAYLFARDFVHECGYRICIDGVSRHSLPFINRARLGADLVKLLWNPSMAEENELIGGATYRELLKRNGINRIVMARCDTPAAIEFGQSLGVSLFQGRYVEEMMLTEQRRRGSGPFSKKRR